MQHMNVSFTASFLYSEHAFEEIKKLCNMQKPVCMLQRQFVSSTHEVTPGVANSCSSRKPLM